jgi:hypothetical protein
VLWKSEQASRIINFVQDIPRLFALSCRKKRNLAVKAVIVLEPSQSLGLLVNTASILSVTLGDIVDGIRGEDTVDQNGVSHPGVIRIPLPILAASGDQLFELWQRAYQDESVFVADFTKTAQDCKKYEEYIDKCKMIATEQMGLLGLALYGNRKKINKLVGNFGILR